MLFDGGTPDAPGEALATLRRAFGEGEVVRFCVDAGNLGLLSRAAREHERPIEVVLPARDVADDRTIIPDEGLIAPTLRRLGGRIETRLSTGRPYVFAPPALDVSTNDLCGLECNMCNNRASKRDPRTIAIEDVRQLLREAADWGIRRVALTGAGEPFRDPAMLDHVAHANALGHLVTITTNGFPISEAVAERLAGSTVSVSVSIHGATEATHEAIVGVAKAGENAWRAVRRMVRARRPGSKLSVGVSTVIQRRNVHEIADLVRRARDEGCDGINIQPINLQHGAFHGHTIVRRDDLLKKAELWPTDGVDALFDQLDRLKAELGRFIHASAERLALFRRYFADASREALGVTCRVGEQFLAVDHRGRIKPCYRLPWSLGDARITRLRELWNSQAYARTRAMVEACPLTCMNNCFFRDKRA